MQSVPTANLSYMYTTTASNGIFQYANLLLQLKNIIHTVPAKVCREIKMVAASIMSHNAFLFLKSNPENTNTKLDNSSMKEGCVICQTSLISPKEIIVGVNTVRQFISLGLLYCHTHYSLSDFYCQGSAIVSLIKAETIQELPGS